MVQEQQRGETQDYFIIKDTINSVPTYSKSVESPVRELWQRSKSRKQIQGWKTQIKSCGGALTTSSHEHLDWSTSVVSFRTKKTNKQHRAQFFHREVKYWYQIRRSAGSGLLLLKCCSLLFHLKKKGQLLFLMDDLIAGWLSSLDHN